MPVSLFGQPPELTKITQIAKSHDLMVIIDGAQSFGSKYEENFFWPNEKPTWTSAALIIAADSIYDFSDGSDIFTRNQLQFL